MPLRPLRVHRDLAPFIEGIDVAWDPTGASVEPRPLIAEAGIDLLISTECAAHTGGRGPFRAEVFGAKTQPLVVRNRVPMWKLRMRLRPGVAPLLLGASARELTDSHVDLAALWGSDAQALLDSLELSSEPDERVRSVERRLAARLAVRAAGSPGWLEARRLAERIEAARGDLRVRDLCRDVGIGERRLERIFRDALGVTPKLYAQLARFRAAHDTLARGGRAAEAALAHGYADQPHLVRDFVRFAGASPSRAIA